MKDLTEKSCRRVGILVFLSLLIFFAYGCKLSLTEVNNNHNRPSQATIPYLLTAAEHTLADNYWGEFPLGYFGNLYGQYWSENQYTAESRYQYRPGVVNDIWDDYYLALNTLQQIIVQNRKHPVTASKYGNNANQIAATRVLMAWTFETLTDIWGSVPYHNALKGAKAPSPKYTLQKNIYASLIDSLQEAVNSFNVNAPAFTSGDIIYGGNAKKWKKFANSLIMRLAIREADAVPQKAAAAFKQAYKSGAMTSNKDNALFVYLQNFPNNNPINQAYKTRDDFGVSKTLISFMNKNNDPRRSAYAEPAPALSSENNKVYHGFPYGMKASAAVKYKKNQPWSRPSKRVRQATAPAIFMTYSEVLFNEAEAAQRGWITGHSAAYFYKKAIMASMKYWDVPVDEAEEYIANHPYQPNNWRQNIGRQKWVALYMQGIQGWAVSRRLDFGLLTPPVGGKLGVTFKTPQAVRYPYPSQEHHLNGKHVKAAIEAQGFSEDNQGQRLWWDESAQSK